MPLQQLGHTSGHGVFGKHHRQISQGLHLRAQIQAFPAAQRLCSIALHQIGPFVY